MNEQLENKTPAAYLVIVTYGTHKDVVYAESPDQAGALLLKRDAIRMGYRDAKIQSVEAWRADRARFAEAKRTRERSEGISPEPGSERAKVQPVRIVSRSARAGYARSMQSALCA